MRKITGEEAATNVMWRLLERFGAQGVSLVVSLVLARILDPSVYGLIAIVQVFTTLLNVFVDSGLGNALIQKKDADDVDFSSVFFFNIVFSSVLYLLLFILAPIIASFYKLQELTAIIRVLGLTVIIAGVKNIQISYVSKNMKFKKFFFATLVGTIGAAAIGIFMAFKGFGVWALITQSLFNQTVDTIILWITVKWRPQRVFSWKRLTNLLSYGYKILIVGLINYFVNDIRTLIIGKKYTSRDLAFYNRGQTLPYYFTDSVNNSLNSVLFPALSSYQDSCDEFLNVARRGLRTSLYCTAPILLGFSACSETFVRLVLTDKWLPCMIFINVFCIHYLFFPPITSNIAMYKASGKSNLYLLVDSIQVALCFIILLITMWFGPLIIAFGMLANYILGFLIRMPFNYKYFKYKYVNQLSDFILSIFPSIVMYICVKIIGIIKVHLLLKLFIQIISGAIIYLAISKFFHIESYLYLKRITFNMIHKRKKND